MIRSLGRILVMLLFGLVGFLIWSEMTYDMDGKTMVTLGNQTLLIDNQYIEEGLLLRVFDHVPGLDVSRPSVGLSFTKAQIASLLALNDAAALNCSRDICIHGDLTYVDDEQLKYQMSPERVADIWQGEGSFHDNVIEKDPNSGFFRVYRKVEYPYSWNVTRGNPELDPNAFERAEDVHDVWIASCLEMTNGAVSCSSFVSAENLIFEFYFDYGLLAEFDSWSQTFRELIESWMVQV